MGSSLVVRTNYSDDKEDEENRFRYSCVEFPVKTIITRKIRISLSDIWNIRGKRKTPAFVSFSVVHGSWEYQVLVPPPFLETKDSFFSRLSQSILMFPNVVLEVCRYVKVDVIMMKMINARGEEKCFPREGWGI